MSIASIVPAYNEEHTVGVVVEILLACPLINEIIVVNDGSTDQTAQVASQYPIRVLNLPENVGKGGAMKAGASQTSCDVLLFVDADLVGLERKHIEDLLEPVLSGKTDMSIGVFSDGRLFTDLALKITPSLSGQRAVRRDLFEAVPNLEHSRYGVETALTQYAENHGVEIIKVPLAHVSHLTKEEKRGIVHGLQARIEMYKDIVRSLRNGTKVDSED